VPPTENSRVATRSAARGLSGPVALIATGSLADELAVILEAEHLAVVRCANTRQYHARQLAQSPAAIVLGVDRESQGIPTVIARLKKCVDVPPVVAVCRAIQRREVRGALAAGVAGIVLEAEAAQTLAPCLHAAVSGQICVPREQWAQIEAPVLSTREKQILGLVVMGYMNSQIAEQLFLAESTVKSHLSSAFGKLGVRSRNEAVNLILDPERGLGTGILSLGGEPLQLVAPQ